MAGQAYPTLGTVSALWRYPVKSMRGEEIASAEVTPRGVRGDRQYALRDTRTGWLASAKNPRKWARLFDCQASYEAEPHGDSPAPIRITLPDGETITSTRPDRDAVLSRSLGREATLIATVPADGGFDIAWPVMEGVVPVGEPLPVENGETMTAVPIAFAAPKETFFDVMVIHLLTTATLARLRALYPEGDFDVRRFRPNIVVEIPDDTADFVENAWVGRTVVIGETLRLKVQLPCPRCVMPTLAQGDILPRDIGILRTIARNNQQPILDMGNMGAAGIYADVAEPGIIRRGDPVRLV